MTITALTKRRHSWYRRADGTPVSWEIFNREFGRQSGIPECCIEYYVTVHQHFYWLAREMRPVPKGFLYIPCDDCLAKNEPVTTIRCNYNPDGPVGLPKPPPPSRRR